MKLQTPNILSRVLNKKYLYLYLFLLGVLVFGGVAINQFHLGSKSVKSETISQQKDSLDEKDIVNGEVAGAQSDNEGTFSPTPTPVKKNK